MSINIFSSNLFTIPYDAKRLLHDAVERTSKAYEVFFDSPNLVNAITGIGHILLARIESVLAFAFVATSSVYFIILSLVLTPCFLAIACPLHLLSLLPGISSCESIKKFTKDSGDAIYRVLRVNLIAAPVILLFLTSAAINILPFPGISELVNLLMQEINALVNCLGPLKSIRLIVPGHGCFEGTKEPISALAAAEEYLRALSTENYLQEETADCVWHYSPART